MPQISPMSWYLVFSGSILTIFISMSMSESFNLKSKNFNKSSSIKNKWHW